VELPVHEKVLASLSLGSARIGSGAWMLRDQVGRMGIGAAVPEDCD
jgi:hypothetical protein